MAANGEDGIMFHTRSCRKAGLLGVFLFGLFGQSLPFKFNVNVFCLIIIRLFSKE